MQGEKLLREVERRLCSAPRKPARPPASLRSAGRWNPSEANWRARCQDVELIGSVQQRHNEAMLPARRAPQQKFVVACLVSQKKRANSLPA